MADDDDDIEAELAIVEPLWLKITVGLFSFLFVMQIILIIVLASDDEPAPTSAPAPSPSPAPAPLSNPVDAPTTEPPTTEPPTTEPDASPAQVDVPAAEPSSEGTTQIATETAETVVSNFVSVLESDADDNTLGSLIQARTTASFAAVFSGGCSVVANRMHCDEASFTRDEFTAFLRGSNAQDFPTLEHNYMSAADIVIDHYSLLGGTNFHGAVVYRLTQCSTVDTSMCIDEALWYADEDARIRTVEEFYAAVDTLNLNALDSIVMPDFAAVFGPGRSLVGGAEHSGAYPARMNLADFKSFVGSMPARCSGGPCSASMQRKFIVTENTVVNTYGRNSTVGTGVAVFRFDVDPADNQTKIVEAYWYKEADDGLCSTTTQINAARGFREALEDYQAADTDEDRAAAEATLRSHVASDYTPVFAAGCSIVGHVQRCGSNARNLESLDGLLLFLQQPTAVTQEVACNSAHVIWGNAADTYGVALADNCNCNVENALSLSETIGAECTTRWNSVPVGECNRADRLENVHQCYHHELAEDANVVTDSYHYTCDMTTCPVLELLPTGRVRHTFEGSTIKESLWYNAQ